MVLSTDLHHQGHGVALTIFSVTSLTLASTLGAMSWCIKARDVALQICPLVQKMPNMSHSTAESTSASSKMRMGLFPPSSREILRTPDEG